MSFSAFHELNRLRTAIQHIEEPGAAEALSETHKILTMMEKELKRLDRDIHSVRNSVR